MLLSEIKDVLGAEFLGDDAALLEKDIATAFGSDLMSDVLAFVEEQTMLLTGLINSQVIRTASMMDMVCVVFVRGKSPGLDMIELAEDCGIVVLKSNHRAYEAAGILYSSGLTGNSVKEA